MSLLDVVSRWWRTLGRTRASQWRIWHYGRYPWSSDHRPSQGATICPSRSFRSLWQPWYRTVDNKKSPSSAPSVSFLATISLARGLNSLSRSPMQYCPFPCAVLNIGDRDFALAISRVKSLTIVQGESNTVRARRGDIERRAEQHVSDKYSPRSWQIDSLQ